MSIECRNRVGIVVGTRPEAIKMAPVIHQLQLDSQTDPNLQPIVYLSGQHRELLDEVLHLFNIVPDFDLAVMTGNQLNLLIFLPKWFQVSISFFFRLPQKSFWSMAILLLRTRPL